MRRTMAFLAGSICGALVGAVTALLLTPYAGSEIRDRVRAQTQDLLEKGQQAAAAKRVELELQLEAFKQGRPVVLQGTVADEAQAAA